MKSPLHFINGQFAPGHDGPSFEKHAPADKQLIATVDEGGDAEVDAAVRAACAALKADGGKPGGAGGVNVRFANP